MVFIGFIERIENGWCMIMADIISAIIAVVVMVVVIIGSLAVYASRYIRVPPNHAMIVFGRKMSPSGMEGYSIVRGGGRFIVPIFEDYAFLHLNVRLLPITLKYLKTDPTKSKRRVNINGVAQVQIGSDEPSLEAAARALLNKTDDEISNMAQQIIEGHIHTLSITMTPEDISSNRMEFGDKITNLSNKDLKKVGMEVATFIPKDVEFITELQKGKDDVTGGESNAGDMLSLKAEIEVLKQMLAEMEIKLAALERPKGKS